MWYSAYIIIFFQVNLYNLNYSNIKLRYSNLFVAEHQEEALNAVHMEYRFWFIC